MKVTATILLLTLIGPARAAGSDMQLFGDVYVPSRVMTQTKTTAADPAVFSGVKDLLASSYHNVVNLEGAVTAAFVTPELKRFLLRMPFELPAVMRAAGINVATLANNHAMDYGYQGIFDTQVALAEAGILHTGAGRDRDEATRPVILGASGRSYCLLAYSRTLPQSFWAGETTAGTASATLEELEHDVRACAASDLYTVVSFHWGQEMADRVAPYQKELARRAIDSGARVVVGHHPHKLQDVEIYKGRPIFYSLGNFAFGSLPGNSGQEGMAVRISRGLVELVPLVVDNAKVHFKTRPLKDGEADPVRAYLPPIHPCRWREAEKLWSCPFGEATTSSR